MNSLPGRKKILLYLYDTDEDIENQVYPFSYCQDGIAQNVELSQNRVSKLLVELEENEMIYKESRRVQGTSQKRYVYFLTEKGKKSAKNFKQDIGEKNLRLKTENSVDDIKLSDIEEYIQGPNSYLFALNNLDDGVLDLTEIGDEDVFIDRKEEMENLKKFIEEKGEGTSNILLIRGCIGIGKTRLIKEFKHTKNENFEFYEGEGHLERTKSFFPFREIFSELLKKKQDIEEDDYFLELLDPKVEDWKENFKEANISKESLFDTIKSLLERFSSERPIIILLDNLQWLDSLSTRSLKYIADELEQDQLYIIGACRKEKIINPASADPLEEVVQSGNSKTIELKPFDWKNTKKLLISKIGRNDIPGEFVDTIYECTQGNPLFIDAVTDELLKQGAVQPLKHRYIETSDEIELPEKVKEIYDTTFKNLKKDEKKILQICSCMDYESPEDMIFIALKNKEYDEIKETVENLKKYNLLVNKSEDRLDFNCEMTRFTVYENLSKSRKKNLHGNLAESLEKFDEDDIENYHLKKGRHLKRTDKFKDAVESYIEGAKKAEELYENEKAINLFEKTLTVLDEHPIPGKDKSKVHEKIADVLIVVEDYREAIDHLKKARKETENERRVLRLNKKIARCLRNISQYENALEYIEEGKEILSELQQLSKEDQKEKCQLLKEKGMVCLRKNEFEECQNFFQEMREISDNIGSKEDKAEAIHYLGTIAYYKSNFDEAKEYLQRSIEIRKETDDLSGLAKSYNNLGVVYRNIQKLHKALEFYKKVNEIKKEIGSREGSPSALDNIGIIYYDLGKLDEAIKYHQKSLEIEREIGDEHGISASLDNIGVSYFGKGEFDKALEYHERSLELKKKLEDRSGISYSLYNMGLAFRGKGEFERALDLLRESLDIRKELEDKLNIGYSNLWIGIVHLDMRELDRSTEFLKNALDVFKEAKSDHGMGMSLTYLGKLKILQNSIKEAEKYLEHSEKIKSKLEEQGYKLIVDRHLAEFYLKKNRLEKSLAHCQEALRRAKRSDMLNQLGKCRKVLGKIYCEKKVLHKGQSEFQKSLEIFDDTGDKKNKAEVLLEWGNTLLENGEKEKGEKKRSEASELFEECGIDISSYGDR